MVSLMTNWFAPPAEFGTASALSNLEQELLLEKMGQANVEAANAQLSNEILNQYKENLQEFEGNYDNASFAHKPTAGSGITIAQGLDAAYTTKDEMLQYGVPKRIVDQLESFGAFTKGTKARIPSNVKLERMTPEEFDIVSANIAAKQANNVEGLLQAVPNMSPTAISVLLNLDHWAGSFESAGESKLTRYKKNLEGVSRVDKLPKNKRGELVSPVKDVLSNPESTDEDLIKALESIKASYIADNPKSARANTLTRYIKKLRK